MSECGSNCGCLLQPVNDKLVVRKVEDQDRTEGGLYLPEDQAEQKALIKGTVVGIGPGLINQFQPGQSRMPMPCKNGDVILYSGYAAQEVEASGETLYVLGANDVACVINS